MLISPQAWRAWRPRAEPSRQRGPLREAAVSMEGARGIPRWGERWNRRGIRAPASAGAAVAEPVAPGARALRRRAADHVVHEAQLVVHHRREHERVSVLDAHAA